MPRKPAPNDDITVIKRELETTIRQAMQLVSDALKLVGELKLKLEGLEQERKR
jgi:hypothetical protein